MQKAIDNIELIKPLLNFTSEDDYYFLQVLSRKKDRDILPFRMGGSNNNSRMIRPYFINSIEHLENVYEEIRVMCELFKARAMICLNKRSYYSSSHQMMVRLAQSIQAKNYFNAKMWNNVSGVYHPTKDKSWIIDIDKDEMVWKDNIIKAIQSVEPDGDKILTEIPSKSGLHLITKAFNVKKYKEVLDKDLRDNYDIPPINLDIHKNNPTNLYIPSEKKIDVSNIL